MGIDSKNDKVVDLKRDEKLKVQLEIRKLASDLKKEVTSSDKKKESIKKMDDHFNNLLYSGSIERSKLDDIKNDVLKSYVEATTTWVKDSAAVETAINPVIDQNIDDVNTLKIKGTTADANGVLSSTLDTPEGSAAKLKLVKEKAAEDKKITIEESIDKSLATIDDLAEAEYRQWSPDKQMTKSQATTAFNNFAHNIVQEVDNQLLTVQEQARMGYKFELNQREQEIINSQTNTNITDGTNNLPFDGQSSEKINTYNYSWSTYIGAYPERNYDVNNTNKDIKTYDIQKDKDIRKAMNDILDPQDKKDLRNNVFGVNLSPENGFISIINTLSKGTIWEAGKQYSFAAKDNKIFIETKNGVILNPAREITRKDLSDMKKAGLINYEHTQGLLEWDDELGKITKILNTADWKDIQTVGRAGSAKTRTEKGIIETANTINNLNLLTEGTTFDFLCDFNGDKILSLGVKNRKERNKETNGLWDIGNITGPQVRFTIDQAIGVQEIQHPGEWKARVIQNIMLYIDVQDPGFGEILADGTKSTDDLKTEFNNYRDLKNCTETNLIATIKKYPEFKTFFGTIIERMNGGSDILTPNLSDTLSGTAIQKMVNSRTWERRRNMEITFDKAIRENPNLKDYDAIELREHLIMQIMNAADGFTIVGSDTQEGLIRNPGIKKEFVNEASKNAFINDLTKLTLSSLSAAIFAPQNGIHIPVNFIKQWHSESGRTLWKVQGGPGVWYNRETKGLNFTLGLGLELAEQYNYNKVINAPLNKVADAEYIGVEGRAIAWLALQDLNVGAEGSAGFNWQKDPVMGINQINRQYENVSNLVFKVSESDAKTSDYAKITEKIIDRIDIYSKKWPYEKFISTNRAFLEANAKTIWKFLVANKTALDSLDASKKGLAINELISIMQTGNMEQWRWDLLLNLHGKLDITKLSFGMTTKAITIASLWNWGKTDGVNTTNLGLTPSSDVIDDGTPTGTEQRLGLFHFYVGCRISSWKTQYHLNTAQLLSKRRDIAEGNNMDNIKNLKDPSKYAEYLSAVFTTSAADGLTIEEGTNAEKGKIKIINTGKTSLPRFLNIRVTNKAKSEIQYIPATAGNAEYLLIGDVKRISATTVALPNGVERRLCIWSDRYEDGNPLNVLHTDTNEIHKISQRETGAYEAINMTDITKLTEKKVDTDGKMLTESPFVNNPTAKTAFVSCFENGQIKNVLPGNITITPKDAKITAGSFIIFKKTVDKDEYTLSVEKDTNPANISLRFIDGTSFVNGKPIEFTSSTPFEVKTPNNIWKTIGELKPEHYADLERVRPGVRKPDFHTFMALCDKPDKLEDTCKVLSRILSNPNFKALKDELDKPNNDLTKRYLVDQFKWLFAYETKFTKDPKTNKPMLMSKFFADRSPVDKKTGLRRYPFIDALKTGNDGLNKEIKTIRKTALEKNTTGYTKENWVDVPNLFWYTAFYRSGNEKKASLVSTADTRVMNLNGKDKNPTYPITSNIDAAKTWTIGMLEKNETQQKLLLETIKANIKDEAVKNALTTTNLIPLLKGSLILDNPLKKVILKSSPVFYFKGECVNESLGLTIDSIEIQDAPIQNIEITKEKISDISAASYMGSVSQQPNVSWSSVSGEYYGSVEIPGKQPAPTPWKTEGVNTTWQIDNNSDSKDK